MEQRFLELGDGKLIDTQTGKTVIPTEINKAFSDSSSSMLKPGRGMDGISRRYIDDLPVPPLQSRAVAIILAYTVFGLHEIDIARILDTPVVNVQEVQASDAYAKFLEALLQNIREHDKDKVRKKLNKAAVKAADKIVELSDSADEKVAFSASKDILDRASKSGMDHHSSSAGRITIRIIEDKKNDPGIEVNING